MSEEVYKIKARQGQRLDEHAETCEIWGFHIVVGWEGSVNGRGWEAGSERKAG